MTRRTSRKCSPSWVKSEAWFVGANAVPIEDHARSATAPTFAPHPDGSINWMCHLGPDAPAILAAYSATPRPDTEHPTGTWRATLSQNYIDNSLTVVTKWSGVTITDYIDASLPRSGRAKNQLRLIRVIAGDAPVTLSFAPAPVRRGSGRTAGNRSGIRVTGSADPLVLVAPDLEWKISYVGRIPLRRRSSILQVANLSLSFGRVATTWPTLTCLSLNVALSLTSGGRRLHPASMPLHITQEQSCDPPSHSRVCATNQRCRTGGGNDKPARSGRGHPQLGLPLLLVARRRDDGRRALTVGQHRGSGCLHEVA